MAQSALSAVDYRALVSHSDLIYAHPRPALESHAVGNGRMGTMVWTSSDSIHLQVNRNDVFAVNKNHIGLQADSVDYCGGCAAIRIDVGGDPFSGGPFEQRLSLYDAEDTIVGNDVVVRCFVSSQTDVMVVEIDDKRPTPQPLELVVSMWREPNVMTPKAPPGIVVNHSFEDAAGGDPGKLVASPLAHWTQSRGNGFSQKLDPVGDGACRGLLITDEKPGGPAIWTQVLNHNFAADTTYSLTVAIGGSSGTPHDGGAYDISLYAGETELVSGAGTNYVNTTPLSYKDLTLTYDPSKSKATPTVGDPLRIVLRGKADIAGQYWTVYDNVRLTADPDPGLDPGLSGYHQARFDFDDSIPQTVLMVQQFTEHFAPKYQKVADYHCRSAVAVKVSGDIAQILSPDHKTRKIIAPAKSGKRAIFISSAASFSKNDDVGTTAVNLLDTASSNSYDTLRQSHLNWWHNFWSRTFVDLSSADGSAEQWEKVRDLHLYYMASSSRGTLPPKWNGSIFSVAGDARQWGAQYWVWTTESLYWPLLASDAVDLTDSFFDMYAGQLSSVSAAGPQRWGVSGGAYYPETAAFDGPVILPEAVGAEWKDVLYGVKPSSRLSDLAKTLCQYCGHLRVLATAPDRFHWISHITSSGSELAIHAWWRYRCTGDEQWLATHAYPLLRSTLEFYRNFAQLGDDGRYHIIGTNAHEDYWGVDDSVYDIAAIRSTAPAAIRAAEILGVDDGLRVQWQDFLDKLAPYVMGSDSGAIGVLADDAWAAGVYHFVKGSHNSEDAQLAPIFPFEDWTLETRDAATDAIAQKTVDTAPRLLSLLGGAGCNTAIRSPIAWVKAGRGGKMPAILSSYYDAFKPMANGMAMFEGPNAHSIEHLGILTHTLQEGLLQSVSPRPAEPEIISVFPAWPTEWEASFRLLARGGFLVTAAIRNGHVEFVEIQSRLGETCRLRNPWGEPCLVTEIGGAAREQAGDILRFDTRQSKLYRVLPKNRPKLAPRL